MYLSVVDLQRRCRLAGGRWVAALLFVAAAAALLCSGAQRGARPQAFRKEAVYCSKGVLESGKGAEVRTANASGQIAYLGAGIGMRNITFAGETVAVLAPLNDEFVGADVLRRGQPLTPPTLLEMLSYIKPGSTVVDAGCNFGSYSVFFAAKAGRGGAVHCFEPQNKMAQLAAANSVLNGFDGIVRVHHAALTHKQQEVEMSSTIVNGESTGKAVSTAELEHATINYGGQPLGKGGEKTTAVTLDSLSLSGVSFMKIDVQGAELIMLYGARDTIRRNLPVVVYEHDSPQAYLDQIVAALNVPREVLEFDIASFFKQLGYTSYQYISDTYQLPPGMQRSSGNRA